MALIYALRYLINGLFALANLDQPKNRNSVKTFMLSVTYAAILSAFKFSIIDNQIIVVIYALFMFGILIITCKPETFRFPLLYSFFITCLTEYVHFFIFKLVSIVREYLKIEEIHSDQPEKLFIGRSIILALYAITIFFIYKFKKVDIASIKKLSNYRIFPVFLVTALFVITYLKYYIKYTNSNQFHDILSFVFVLFVALSLVFLFSSKSFLDTIEKLNKEKTNTAIEESKMRKNKGSSGLMFVSEELNSEMNSFLKMLSEIGMDIEDKKAKQIAYCAVLLNHEENPQKVNISSVIYPCAANILDRQAKTIESNISNAIKNLWNSCDKETLEKINRNYKMSVSSETGCPTPKEFLLYLIQKYRKANFISH